MTASGYLRRHPVTYCATCLLFACAPSVFAQTAGPDTEPVASAPPSTADDAAPEVASARVIEVSGSVDWASAETSPLVDEGWSPVQLHDELAPGTQIRTGLRSHVNLQFGETTVVSIRSATHASVDQFYRSATTETVRVGLGYGTVRGGSTEGPLEADVQVESTVATLAKRGTEGWQLWVEPTTGRFRVSLADHGLVEAIQRLGPGRTRSKTVRPGEYATPQNMANLWLTQAAFDRNVQFYASETITTADAVAVNRTTRGVGVLSPGAGAGLADYSGRSSLGRGRTTLPSIPNQPATMVLQPLARAEGNFGTGTTFRVLRPVGER